MVHGESEMAGGGAGAEPVARAGERPGPEDQVSPRWGRLLALVLGASAAGGGRAGAQSTLDSPPNLSNWVAVAGGLQFNLLHRFSIGPAPSHKLQNAPTLSFAYGMTPWLSVGVNYASASEVVQAYPNEWEFLARLAPFTQDGGAPVDMYLQAGYNDAAESLDGQLLVARRMGPVRAVGGLGLLEDALRAGSTRATVAAGATVRVHGLIGLTADASTFANRDGSEDIAWSAGVNVGVSGTPHTMSLHATNVASRTLQGIARGTGVTRYGFEYTIPISVGRFFSRAGLDPPGISPLRSVRYQAGERSRPAKPVVVDIRSLRYSKGKIEIEAGTTIEWRNRDPLAHTVTSDSEAFDSGEIRPEGRWSHTFTTPGTYTYHCTPHPAMKATVVVRPNS
jgi:plastocyanin